MPLPKPCKRCNERFVPTGGSQKICLKCLRKSQLKTIRRRKKPMKLKHPIFAQIRALEKRKQLKLPMYAIIDKKGKVIEKCRLMWTATQRRKELSKDYFEELRICKLDEDGELIIPKRLR